jgi:hypothetical protein
MATAGAGTGSLTAAAAAIVAAAEMPPTIAALRAAAVVARLEPGVVTVAALFVVVEMLVVGVRFEQAALDRMQATGRHAPARHGHLHNTRHLRHTRQLPTAVVAVVVAVQLAEAHMPADMGAAENISNRALAAYRGDCSTGGGAYQLRRSVFWAEVGLIRGLGSCQGNRI